MVELGWAALVTVALTVQDPAPAPPALEDGWPTAVPAAVGVRVEPLAELAAAIRERNEHNVHAVLVARRGKLVWEQYFTGTDQNWGATLGRVRFHRDRLHDLRSVSKSVTSALVGIVLAEEPEFAVDEPVLELLGRESRDGERGRRAIRLEHVLTMSAGLAWDESVSYGSPRNSEIRMIRSRDPLGFVLGQELVAAPGSAFEYSGGLTQVLAGVVETRTGRSVDVYAATALFEPLGIRRFEWRKHTDGSVSVASGLRLRPRDLAKIGQLYLDGGTWNGRRILPEAWVQASFVAAKQPYPHRGYGYQWWITRLTKGRRTLDVPTAIGNGGQRVFLVAEHDLVVVVLAGRYNAQTPFSDRILLEFVLPAVGASGWRLRDRR